MTSVITLSRERSDRFPVEIEPSEAIPCPSVRAAMSKHELGTDLGTKRALSKKYPEETPA